jgi:hypothetical protein
LVEQFLRKVRPRRWLSELNLKNILSSVFPAANVCSSLYELTSLFLGFVSFDCLLRFNLKPLALPGSRAGEAQSKHKEGFTSSPCGASARRYWRHRWMA